MRIVELINTLDIGGAERMVVDLSTGLQYRNHEVTVVCLRNSGPLQIPLSAAGVRVIALEKDSSFSARTVRKLSQILSGLRTEIVHTHNPLVHHYGTAAARMADVPLVIGTLHGPGNLNQPPRKTELVYELTCLFSDCIVACCGSVHQHLQRVTAIARRRSVVIPNGIDVEPFLSIPPAHPSDSDVIFGAVGRLAPVKDYSSLLKAFASLRKRLGRCRLEFLGDGPLRSQLEREASQLGIANTVRFRGAGLDVPGFLRSIDVFVTSSLSEGLPLTVLEAMAAARPVVGTNVGAIPELVREGNCGFLAPSGNPAQLANTLIEAASDDRLPQKGLKGRQLVEKMYSVNAMVEGYEQLFQNMLVRKRPRS